MNPKIKLRRRLAINIVPLVDVLIILLFFFLMTLNLPSEKVLNIALPEMDTAGRNFVDQDLVLAVNQDGDFFINWQKVSPQELISSLSAESKVNPDRPVLVMADKETPLKEVTFIMDECRKVSLDRIRLQTQ